MPLSASKPCLLLALAFVATHLTGVFAATDPSACRIEVVDKESGWPVPLVELRTTHHSRFVTDNAGIIALDSPELMGAETWFTVHGHGYEVKKDGFGYQGVRLTPQLGQTLRIELERKIIARRMGRLTGAGIFAESQKLGVEGDWKESGVVGCDSVQNAVHRGRLFWVYGDTTLAKYPLGIFHGTGGTSAIRPELPDKPPLRFAIDYFRDDAGKVAPIAAMPGEGPTWVTGFISLPDSTGTPRLVCSYMKVKPPLEAYAWGLAVWDENTSRFKPHRTIWTKSDATPHPPPIPDGHPAIAKDAAGREWVYYGNPLPTLRHPATFEAWQEASTWETLKPVKDLPVAGGNGRVTLHSGSIAWNGWRKRWVTVFMEKFGKPSVFGELWYAEGESPTGPWGPAVKIATHDNYTFYNPRIHPEFSDDASPALYFEATYTAEFANKPQQTPRYDYNQMLYRLDLDDARLKKTHEIR
jgi:hypothetical protein